ncbi:MAG: lysophospholipid acyltransferase family protein [Nitrospinae bacterium]|nr:lysophospholipid acyltransferase family protein [Nitrospinota bacterium]
MNIRGERLQNMIFDWIQYAVLLSFIRFINIFPFKISVQVLRGMGLLLYLFDSRHRKTALSNLRASFPEKHDTEITGVAKDVFKNIGSIVAEMARVLKDGNKWLEKAVIYEGMENLTGAIKKGNGALIMTGHIGNWEIGALAGKDYKLNFVVRTLDNRFLNKIIYKIRTTFNSGVIEKKNAVREILRCLKRNELVAILMDQNTSRDEGVFVDFFGRKACTTPVIATLAMRTGAPVLPIFAIREGTGKIKIIVGEAIEVIPSGDYQEDIERYTAVFTGIIESVIRKYPDQWLWLHRRWKTKP